MTVYNMDDAFAAEYESRLYMMAQQKGWMLKPYLDYAPFSSAADLFYDRLAPADAPQPNSTLHGDTPVVEDDFSVRMLSPALYETGHILDADRLARLKINPQGGILSNDAEAFGRFFDSKVIATAFADVKTGKYGAGPVATFAGGSIGINGDGTLTTLGTAAVAGTSTAMTVNKIRLMKWICDKANMGNYRVWVVDPSDIAQMLGLLQVTSSDYNTVKALAAGEVDTFCGFKFVNMNGLPTVGTGVNISTRTLIFEANKALKAVELSPMKTEIGPDASKKFNTRIYSKMDFGIGRAEEALVHECLNLITIPTTTIISQ
jgi:hypothetical protein